MTGTRLPDQNNEQHSYLVARVLPTPRPAASAGWSAWRLQVDW